MAHTNEQRRAYRRSKGEEYKIGERRRQQKKRNKIRKLVRQIKIDEGCSGCGEIHPACLHFHHSDPTTKIKRINLMVSEGIKLSALLEEIGKCVVLCANCHAKRHWDEHDRDAEFS